MPSLAYLQTYFLSSSTFTLIFGPRPIRLAFYFLSRILSHVRSVCLSLPSFSLKMFLRFSNGGFMERSSLESVGESREGHYNERKSERSFLVTRSG